LRDLVLGSGAAGWRESPETLLAAIVLLDQFSRNIHRGTAEAFAADPLALGLTLEAIGKGWDLDMDKDQLQFLYLPLEHAEDAAMQRLSVQKFASLDDDYLLGYARKHADVIERFGRFPSRNAALGRKSTSEELEFLKEEEPGGDLAVTPPAAGRLPALPAPPAHHPSGSAAVPPGASARR
jgi:uncharacterized protein (DUF924 family)